MNVNHTYQPRLWALLAALATAVAALPAAPSDMAASQWVFPGPDGKLVYKKTADGDKIMDFSYAGYMGGGVKLPAVEGTRLVRPSGGDDTAVIQSAIDAVSAMPMRDGFRGAVVLANGTFTCSETIKISANGVVLRGSGSGADKDSTSTIKLVGKPHNGIAVAASKGAGGASKDAFKEARTTIADKYVPSGAMAFSVADAKGFAVGDVITIAKPVTEAWVKFMHMDDMVRDGKAQTWLPVGRTLTTERRIAAISGNTITLDVPLADSFDARYLNPPGTAVAKIKPPARVSQAGIEHLHIECPLQAIKHTDPHFSALRINGQDCWVRNVVIDETMNSVAVNGSRITLRARNGQSQGPSRRLVPARGICPQWRPGPAGPVCRQCRQCLVFGDRFRPGRPNCAAELHLPRRRSGRVAPALDNRHALRQSSGSRRRDRVQKPRRNGLGAWLVNGLGRGLELRGQGLYHPEPARIGQLDDRLRRRQQAIAAAI